MLDWQHQRRLDPKVGKGSLLARHGREHGCVSTCPVMLKGEGSDAIKMSRDRRSSCSSEASAMASKGVLNLDEWRSTFLTFFLCRDDDWTTGLDDEDTRRRGSGIEADDV